jgi:hypothetical protein
VSVRDRPQPVTEALLEVLFGRLGQERSFNQADHGGLPSVNWRRHRSARAMFMP